MRQVNQRLCAIDWLRVLTLVSVFFFHVAHIFDFDVEGSMRNAESSLAASVYVFFGLQWQMPLFFLLAGVSRSFSLKNRSASTYLQERARRLLMPFLFGSVVLIPWNGYMSALNQGTFDGPYWSYIPLHFQRTWASLMVPPANHGPIALYYSSWHLWFLGYLLMFSVLSLLWPRRLLDTSRLAALCERPAGLLALAVPIALIKLALAASFPAYLDWADALVFFTVFFYGFLFMTDARFLGAVERQAFLWLAVGCLCFAVMLGAYAAGYLGDWLARPAYTAGYLLYQLLAALNTWAWVLALLGCGLRWLNYDNAVLRYASEAALPFYMIHQLAVLTVACAVVEWRAGVAVKMLAIGVIAFVATMAIYELLIRRSPQLRPLFGLKAAIPTTSTVSNRSRGQAA